MPHPDNHTHSHVHIFRAPNGNGETRIGIAFALTCIYMIVEAGGGLFFNSLALLADAGHMLSDALALGLTWMAISVGKRSPSDRLTFGFIRSEILAALVNGVLLWLIVAVIFYEAIQRLMNPEPVQGLGMFSVATVGLVLNVAMAAMLFSERNVSLNIKGAFLHVISDAMGSVGAIGAGLLIICTKAYWIDPAVSAFIGILILVSSWGLLRESINVLMEGVPKGVQLSEIESALVKVNGVCCVYDLHVWSISSSTVNLSAHVVLTNTDRDSNDILIEINSILGRKFHIDHSTIQIEKTHEMRSEANGKSCRAGTYCNYIEQEKDAHGR
ncbi:MAG: cation diffusion facilitator family transporter [Desulfomonilaceae bacterium]